MLQVTAPSVILYLTVTSPMISRPVTEKPLLFHDENMKHVLLYHSGKRV